MRELARRIEKLEQQLETDACECKSRRPVWLRSMNDAGEMEPDQYPEPAPVVCSVHGQVEMMQIILCALEPAHA